MDLNEIRIFAEVVKAGSFTGAAKILKMPKSTVSRKVADLEERLGARLLQRSTRNLNLTDAGRAYAPYAERIVVEMEAASTAVAHLESTPRGLLRVTVPLSCPFLGDCISKFIKVYPDVEVELVATDKVIDIIAEGFDLALRAGVLEDSSLISRKLGELASYMVASPSYLDTHGTPTQFEDLQDHVCLSFGSSPTPRTWTLQNKNVLQSIPIRPSFTANDFDILESATCNGLGIAVLPSDRCLAGVAEKRLVRIMEPWATPPIPIQALYPSSQNLSPKVTAFIAQLTTRCWYSGRELTG